MLLPKIMQFRDPELSMPLGAAKPRDERKHMLDGCSPEWIFENIPHFIDITEADCRQIKGAAQASQVVSAALAVPVAVPPSPATPVAVPTFKVGDRVQYIQAVLTRGNFPPPQAQRTVMWADAERVEYVGGGWDPAEYLELILPSEPKEADGWIEWKGGECPIPEAQIGTFMLRFADGQEKVSEILHANEWGDEWRGVSEPNDRIVAYRLVKQQ